MLWVVLGERSGILEHSPAAGVAGPVIWMPKAWNAPYHLVKTPFSLPPPLGAELAVCKLLNCSVANPKSDYTWGVEGFWEYLVFTIG